MRFDSVFSAELEAPFSNDAPLIPVAEINRALDAIEQASSDRQFQILQEQTDLLLQRATPFLVNRDAEGIAALNWNAGVALQAPIFSVWSMGWQLGSAHMLREMAAAVPTDLLTSVRNSGQFARFATPQQEAAIAQLLQLQPGTLVNTAAEQAVLQRTIQLAGNFSNSQLAQLKLSLIGAISPDADGKVLSRKQLLDQIQQNLQVGRVRGQMIARTELTNAYNDSRVVTALQSPLVTHFRFLAISDNRTTPICRSRNGMLIPVSDQGAIAANKPALHVKCRSTLSPVMASINPTHQQWATDPDRDWARRQLVPLPKGWQTGDLPKVPTPAPAPLPTKPKKASTAFPRSIDKLETVRPLGGSTGATLVRDPKTDRLFVLKRGSSADHLREEFAADAAYQALGVPVPKAKLYETATGPVKLAEYVDGRSLKEILATATDLEKQALLKQLQKNFAADALLGNWDVVGMDFDNILVDQAGKAWRIDNGGSLRFRAQGALKGGDWNNHPTELFSLRNPAINPEAAEVFGGMRWGDVADQMEAIAKQEKKLLKALPVELHPVVQGRLAEMRHLSQVSRTLLNDSWTDDYTDRFARHTLGLRQAGIVDRLPQRLTQSTANGVGVIDEFGDEFDSLRGSGSIVGDLKKYMAANGGDHSIIQKWMSSQASDSWNSDGKTKALKFFYANQRSTPVDNYFWRYGLDSSRNAYKDAIAQYGQDRYADSLASWHAFNHEAMLKTDFARKNADNSITLIRTESKNILSDLNGLKPGARGVTIQRGFAESTSVYREVQVFGSEMTVQNVPSHRIFGTYWTEKSPGKGGSGFMGDRENEFVALLDGVPFDYLGESETLAEAIARKQAEAGGAKPFAPLSPSQKPTKKTKSKEKTQPDFSEFLDDLAPDDF